MKKKLLFAIIFIGFNISINAQSLELLKKDKSPVQNDTILTIGSIGAEEIKVPVYVKNTTGADKNVYVKLYVKQLVDGAVASYCWNSCFDIATAQSTSYLTVAANDTVKNFYCLYKPKENSGITEIMFTFFVDKDEDDSTSVTVTYEVLPTGVDEISDFKNSIRCYPNPAIDKVYFDFNSSITSSKTIVLYDIVGNKVKQLKIEEAIKTEGIDISDLNSGLYIWTLISDGEIIKSERLIKK